jgi:hypothetical protein
MLLLLGGQDANASLHMRVPMNFRTLSICSQSRADYGSHGDSYT